VVAEVEDLVALELELPLQEAGRSPLKDRAGGAVSRVEFRLPVGRGEEPRLPGLHHDDREQLPPIEGGAASAVDDQVPEEGVGVVILAVVSRKSFFPARTTLRVG
jgi:hypothetical protein